MVFAYNMFCVSHSMFFVSHSMFSVTHNMSKRKTVPVHQLLGFSHGLIFLPIGYLAILWCIFSNLSFHFFQLMCFLPPSLRDLFSAVRPPKTTIMPAAGPSRQTCGSFCKESTCINSSEGIIKLDKQVTCPVIFRVTFDYK